MGKKSKAKKERQARIARGEPARVEKKQELAPDRPHVVNDATFRRLVGESELPVLVDFWAEWCGPCKALAPTIDALAKERAGQLRVLKYDTDRNKVVASEMGIKSLPTMVIFQDGEVADLKRGYLGPDAVLSWVDKTIGLKKGLLGRLLGSG